MFIIFFKFEVFNQVLTVIFYVYVIKLDILKISCFKYVDSNFF